MTTDKPDRLELAAANRTTIESAFHILQEEYGKEIEKHWKTRDYTSLTYWWKASTDMALMYNVMNQYDLTIAIDRSNPVDHLRLINALCNIIYTLNEQLDEEA